MKNQFTMALIASLLAGELSAKTISGRVESSEGRPLVKVDIKVTGSDVKTQTDEDGRFKLDLPIGEHTLDIEGGSQAHFHQIIQVSEETDKPFLITLETEAEHKVVVRANPLEHTSLDMATPTIMLAGDELTLKRSSTLGEILQFEPGLSVSSFGPSVSRPVIRGLGGARVTITNNQMTVQDASTTSADHDVGVEPLLAEQIEVVKGPATLLYGSGAIGGVVNVTDRKINSDINDEITGGIELRLGNSATGEQALVFSLDGGSESWNWHLDGFKSETDDLEIPGESESEILHESEGHEEEEEASAAGILDNSASETQGGSIGLTAVKDWGHIGAAVSFVDKQYGVPGHGHHEEEEIAGSGEEHEEEVAIDMTQTRYDFQASVDSPVNGLEEWFVGYALTDYEHVELEGDEIGTQFSNQAWEAKSYVKHENWHGWSGVWGVQFTERDFEALGDEAFVPPSVTHSRAVFVVEEKEVGNLKLELGARFEKNTIEVIGQPDADKSGLSFSFGNVYTISEHNKLALNFSRAFRFASVEELYSQGPHVATQSYEVGNQNLDAEISNNFDLSYRFETEGFNGEFNLYWNQFEDFIYGANVADDDSCLPVGAAAEAAAESLQLICYQQQDADFKGAEFQMMMPLNPGSMHAFSVGIIADIVKAEFDDGSNVPRVPPRKTGLVLNYDYQALSASINYLHHDDKSKVADNELPTDGFDLVNLDIAYRLPFSDDELFLFFKGKNLLDEEARDHTSFLKDLAPRAGRNFVLGARYTF